MFTIFFRKLQFRIRKCVDDRTVIIHYMVESNNLELFGSMPWAHLFIYIKDYNRK